MLDYCRTACKGPASSSTTGPGRVQIALDRNGKREPRMAAGDTLLTSSLLGGLGLSW